MQEEIWKDVPSLPGVRVSSLGRIKFPDRQAAMPRGNLRWYRTKPTYGVVRKASKTARHCYMGVYNSFYGNVKVHRAVCEAFHGPAPEGRPYVLHLDENALNNRPENLKWGSQKENLNASGFLDYCKSRTGDKNPKKKANTSGRRLTKDDVIEIRELLKTMTISEIANLYGMSVSSIHHIKSGHTHKSV